MLLSVNIIYIYQYITLLPYNNLYTNPKQSFIIDSLPQTYSLKHKAKHKLLTNPYTKKVYAYIKKITDNKKEIEKLKRSN